MSEMFVLEDPSALFMPRFFLPPRSGSSSAGRTTVDAKPGAFSFRYSLDFPDLGHCIIINNKNFDKRTGYLSESENFICPSKGN